MSKLFNSFKPISKQKWIEKINLDLKGEKYIDKIISNAEGIKIHPVYHSDDNIHTYNCNFPDTWESYQLIDATKPIEGNKRALNALKNNISGLCFSNPNNLSVLLKNISIEHVRIDFSNYSIEFPQEWSNFTKNIDTKGAFHGKTANDNPNYYDTIFAKGSVKEQLNDALTKGLKNKNPVQFHFEIGNNMHNILINI